MSGEHLSAVCCALAERCAAGNSWPPDLAEFITLAAECAGGSFGFTAARVIAEYTNWRNSTWRYSSSADYPWPHPVMYHICLELRCQCTECRLTLAELKKLAGTLLSGWEKKVANGFSVPPVHKRISAPAHPTEPTPAQKKMHEEFLRRRACRI